MKTLIAVLLLSISSLAMAGGFYTVPNPYEQRPSPRYGNTGGFQSVPNPYEQRPTPRYENNRDDNHERRERDEHEHEHEHERYNREQRSQGNQAQRYRR